MRTARVMLAAAALLIPLACRSPGGGPREVSGGAARGEAAPAAGGARFTLTLLPLEGGRTASAPVEVRDPAAAGDLEKEVEASGARFTVRRYSPHLRIEERIEAAPPRREGFAALRVAVTAGGGRREVWLIPGSRFLGRAALDGAVLECWPRLSRTELDAREVALRSLCEPGQKVLVEVKRDDRLIALPIEAGRKVSLDDPPRTLEAVRAFRRFALDPKTGEAREEASGPLNPALDLLVTGGGPERRARLFALFPEFSSGAEDDDLTLRLADPEAEAAGGRPPLIVLVDAPGGPYRVIVISRGRASTVDLDPRESLWTDGVKLEVLERLPSARVAQEAQEDPQAGPAVLLEWADAGGGGSRWIATGAPEEIRAGGKGVRADLRGSGGPHAPSPGAPGSGRKSLPAFPPGHPAFPAPPAGGGLPPGHPELPPPSPARPGGR